ncbi:helix-turn-helix domain-containing protein [Thalassospira xiamenensis]|uniref:helix-turn-helix domain-containing protein n=1 Tax=Thalassospira xiamenensis TaxID=220697 RepID=UPI003AA91611
MNAITNVDHKSRATDIDKAVGAQVRFRRTELGLSQQQLADFLGVTYQQVAKYERGENRIGASRLYEIAIALKVKPAFFYENLDEIEAVSDRGLLELVRDYKSASVKDRALIRMTASHLSGGVV